MTVKLIKGVYKMPKKKITDDFIMSPKIDFVFKLLFGDEKTKIY